MPWNNSTQTSPPKNMNYFHNLISSPAALTHRNSVYSFRREFGAALALAGAECRHVRT
jgi:hypothetical protein